MQDVKILSTCREKIDLLGIVHNNCIDHDLIIRLAHKDKALMDGNKGSPGSFFNLMLLLEG